MFVIEVEKECQRSLERSRLRRAEAAEREQFSLFHQHWRDWCAGVGIALVVIVLLYSMKLALS